MVTTWGVARSGDIRHRTGGWGGLRPWCRRTPTRDEQARHGSGDDGADAHAEGERVASTGWQTARAEVAGQQRPGDLASESTAQRSHHGVHACGHSGLIGGATFCTIRLARALNDKPMPSPCIAEAR